MSTGPAPLDYHALFLQVWESLTTFRRAQLAVFCLVVYEWLVTFDLEWDRIWQRKLNIFTIYWVLVRYVPIVAWTLNTIDELALDVPTKSCGPLALATASLVVIGTIIAHFSFALRLFALYSGNRFILCILLPILGAELTVYIVRVTQPGAVFQSPDLGIPYVDCTVEAWTTKVMLWQNFAYMVFDSVAFALMIGRYVYYVRKRAGGDLLRMLLTDGIGYFAVVFLFSVANSILLLHAALSTQVFFTRMTLVVPTIIVPRMILRLRALEPEDLQSSPSRRPGQGYTFDVLTASFSNFGDFTDGQQRSNQWR